MTTATLTPRHAGTVTVPGMSADDFDLMLAAATGLTQRLGPDGSAGPTVALAEQLGALRAPDQYRMSDDTEYLKCPIRGAHWAITR